MTSLLNGRLQPLGVARRAEEVRGLEEAVQFIGRNQRYILCSAAADDDDFLIVGYPSSTAAKWSRKLVYVVSTGMANVLCS